MPRPKKARAAVAGADKPEGPPAVAGAYAIGTLVTHPMFGDGTVTAVAADKLTISFKDGRVKQILDAYVKHRRR